MAKYKNLPGINLELLDGNLRIDEQITGPVVLVIGAAYSGPSNRQFLMSDSNQAARIFGADSPLIKKATEAKLGGAKNIILYRIGGKPASIKDLFGLLSEITTKEETAVAGSKYSVYIGPQPNDPLTACLIIFEGSNIVYSNVPGAEVDNGKFTIVGFDDTFAYRVGTPSAPVLLEDVITSIKSDIVVNATGDGIETSFDLPGADGVVGTVITEVTVGGTPVLPADYTFVAGGVGTPDSVLFDVAPAAAAAIVIKATRPHTVAGATYVPSEDSIGVSWQKYYELVDQAYADLETTIATEVLVDRAILDAPNIADGSVAADKLDYVIKAESNGVTTYEWSTTKILYKLGTGTTPSAVLADKNANGQPIVSKRYNEVNFAHQLGEFCHTITENEKFILGFIGTSLPVATTTSSVASWIGTLPQTDFDGSITVNGTGLLGNKYMAGSTTQIPGFYHTDSGFPDGNPQYDSNGAIIDLGKFISVVPAVVTTPNIASLGSSSGIVNGAGVYAGLVTNVVIGNSTTNEVLPRVSLPFTIKKQKLDELSGAGYVTFQEKTRGVVVVSGELATGPASDYDYISTAMIIGSMMNRIRTRLEPYIGKGLTEVQVAAMQTAVEAEFQDAVSENAVVKYYAQVTVLPVQNGAGRVSVPFTIVPPFELREVNASVKLAYDI